MGTVYLPNSNRDLAEQLVTKKMPYSGRSIFPTYMHLMVFSSMVGFSIDESSILEGKDKGNEIPTNVFENNLLDGLTYLLALVKTKDGEILRDTNDTECWKIIESYSASGISEISNWMIDNPGDTEGVDTILNNIKRMALEIVENDDDIDTENIDFSV